MRLVLHIRNRDRLVLSLRRMPDPTHQDADRRPAVHPMPANDRNAAAAATARRNPLSCGWAIATRTTMTPGTTFINGNGQMAENTRRCPIAPTRRRPRHGESPPRLAQIPDRSSPGRDLSGRCLKRLKSNGHFRREMNAEINEKPDAAQVPSTPMPRRS